MLKDVGEPLAGAFYNRLISAFEQPPQMPTGTPACFHPLLIRSVLAALAQQAERGNYSYQALAFAAKCGMPAWLEFTTHCFRHAANAIDAQILRYSRSILGILDTFGCFVYEDLISNAPSGRRSPWTFSRRSA